MIQPLIYHKPPGVGDHEKSQSFASNMVQHIHRDGFRSELRILAKSTVDYHDLAFATAKAC